MTHHQKIDIKAETAYGNIKMSVSAKRAKSWLITYPQCPISIEEMKIFLLEKEKIKEHGIRYMVICQEHHQDGGEHLHVFIQLEAPMRLGKKDMEEFDYDTEDTLYHPNIQSCRSPKDAIKYVKKDGNYWEYGICPYVEVMSTKQKNDLIRNKNILDLVEEGSISLYQVPTLHKALKILEHERMEQETKEKPKVHWFYGNTGTGKTLTAYQDATKLYGRSVWISGLSGRWFEGYSGQRGAILDDIRASSWPFVELLRILDRYKTTVEVKGGSVNWIPKEIWITTPNEPRRTYCNFATGEPFEDIEQLERRIDELREFK